jgi:hypothetical protein
VKKLSWLAGVVAACCLSVPAVSAAAGNNTYVCTGIVGAGPLPFQFTPTTIDANVLVPEGASCFMYVTTVTGNVTVEGTLGGFGDTFEKNLAVKGGQLFFPVCLSIPCGPLGAHHVVGNVIVSGTDGVIELDTIHVEKNVIVNGATNGVDLTFATVEGNLSILNSANVSLFDSFFHSDVNLIGDTVSVGAASVEISGMLNCQNNDPPPSLPFGVGAGAYNGQCVPNV